MDCFEEMLVTGGTDAAAAARLRGGGDIGNRGGRDHPSVLEKAGQVLILDDKSLIK